MCLYDVIEDTSVRLIIDLDVSDSAEKEKGETILKPLRLARRLLFVLIAVLLIASLFLIFSAQAANVTRLSPSDDSWVDFKTSDTNYGNDTEIHVKADGQTRRSYLKFDLSAVPAGTAMTSAKLYLYCTAGTPSPLQVDVHETNDSWSEGSITWNNAPAVGAFVASNATVDGIGKYYSWDISSYTQSQFGGDKILSVVVKFPLDDPYQNNPNVHRDFASKEETDPNKHPYLEITYTGPAPLSVSISPTSVAMNLGQHVTFTSNVSGGTPPYSYQWYLNGAPVPGATSASWTFTPISSGSFTVYVNVTDNVGVTVQSNTASVTVNPALSVSITPTSVEMDLGQSKTFTSSVSGGTSPYSYQWYLDGAPVSGATSSSWAFTPTSIGSYTVYLNVTDNVGATAQSNTVPVTVNPWPTVSITPTSVVMDLGQSVTFTSTVSGGTPPYTYQWYLNGVPVTGANSSTWTFTPTSPGSYTVYVNVTDSGDPTVKSNVASVTVNPALSVSISPTSVTMDVGQSQTFTSTVSGGTPPYSYQWYLDGAPVSGATSSSWTFTPTSSGSYSVYVNITDNVGATAQSNTASVTVNPELSVSISPTSVVMNVGQSQTFTSSVSGGTQPYTYQWYLDGSPVGTNSSSWTFTPLSAGYYLVHLNVTDSVSVTAKSNIASVTVSSAFYVSVTPTSLVMNVGESKTFSSTVSGGTSPYTYQWYMDGTPVGTNSSSWTFTPTSEGSYTVYLNVTDKTGAEVQSNIVPVTVNPWPTVSISPTSVVMDVGQSVMFTSTVSGGTPPYTYQWYLDGTPVGVNSSSWTFTPVDPGVYTVYVNVTDSSDPTVKSNVASVTVNPPLSVSISPTSVTMNVGNSQLFTSSVSGGTSPYTYQWYLDDNPVSGATSSSWMFTPASPGSYSVYVNVTDNVGVTAQSNIASVTVNPEFSVSISPTSVEMDVGESKTFTSSVSGGTSPYTYQWYLDDTPVGSDSSSWTFTPSSIGSYTVYLNVTDDVGVTAQSNLASVTVYAWPTVSISPTSVEIDVGQSVTFTSTVEGGTPPYTYQWYLDGAPVSGATSSSWTFTPTNPGEYTIYVNVTDSSDPTVKSNPASVKVNPPSPPPPVGGYAAPINIAIGKEASHLLASQIGLAFALLAAAVAVAILLTKRRSKTSK